MNFFEGWTTAMNAMNTWVEGWSEMMDEIYEDWFGKIDSDEEEM